MRILKIVFTTAIFTIAITTAVAQETCQAVVQTMINNTQTACAGLDDNQACYGNRFVLGSPSITALNVKFLEAGDIVDTIDIESYEIQPFSVEEDSWGILKTRIETDSEQVIEMVAFGSQDLWDATRTSPIQYTGTILNGVDMLELAGDYSTAFRPLETDEEVVITATESNGQFVRVIDSFGNAGWIESASVATDGEIFNLPMIEGFLNLDPTTLPPMQGIYVSRVMGFPECVDVPTAGVLFQTVASTEPVSIWVNSVNIELNGTMYITAGLQEEMWIDVIAGTAQLNEDAFVTCAGDTCRGLTIPAGARATMPFTEAYGVFQPKLGAYDIDNANKLPLALLTDPVEPVQPLAPGQIQAAQSQ